MFYKQATIVLVLLMVEIAAHAFDTETHALITKAAFDGSVLGEASTLYSTGLSRLNRGNPLNLYWRADPEISIPYYYADGIGNSSNSPYFWPEAYERCQMQEFLYPNVPQGFQIFGNTVSLNWGLSYTLDNVLPIQNWIVRGAIREDDTGFFPGAPSRLHCRNEFKSSSQGFNPRSLNHFYDPYANIALTLLGCSGCVNNKAIDWATGYSDSLATVPQENISRLNHYSYIDARNMFWWGITRQTNKTNQQPLYTSTMRQLDSEDRMHALATSFRALGDVVHLLEDMGQPQHTRNDPHAVINSDEQQAFEDYTNDRILGVTDESNSYVRGFFGEINGPLTAPPLDYYPVVRFSTPLRFFTTRGDNPDQTTRAGLADYTNRGFFTGGTLPEVTSEPLPPKTVSSYGVAKVPCEGLLSADSRLQAVTCRHYTLAVPDVVDSAYQDELPHQLGQPSLFSAPPLVSESVFRDIDALTWHATEVHQTAIGTAELDNIGNMTIPRAVGYATGMLNFFFRGSLQVTAPDDGIYAVINHGTPHSVLSGGVPVKADGVTTFGFEKVRLKVKNITMADAQGNGHTLTESGTGNQIEQTMSATVAGDVTNPSVTGPKLVAIARYHRNPCYQPDLSGEFSIGTDGAYHNPAGCTVATMRSAWPEISVSQSVAVAEGSLDGPEAQLLTFDFSHDPIPINATDLFIQVAYRGQLGAEQDGIAVGMVDISEPTYFALFNGTDYVLDTDANTWRKATTNEPQPRTMVSIEICGAPGGGDPWYTPNGTSWQVYVDASQSLVSGHVIRLALLTSSAPLLLTKKSIDQNGYDWGWASITQMINKVDDRQAPYEDGTGFNPLPFTYGRGSVVGDYITALVHSPLGSNGSSPYLAYWDWGYFRSTPSIASLNSEAIGTAIDPGTTKCSF